MARTVLSNNDEVAHHWAHQVHSHGRSGNGNTSYEGRLFYSYSTPIACLVELPKGDGMMAVITGRNYGVTTSSHTSSVRYASRHLHSFYLPHGMGVWSGWGRLKGIELRRAIRRRMIEHAASLEQEHKRAAERGEFRNKTQRAKSWSSYLSAVSRTNEFCSIARLPEMKAQATDGLDDEAIRAYRKARAEREAEAERKRAEYAEHARKSAEERLESWLSGGHGAHLGVLGTAYLRLNPSNPEITETSIGARVPTEHVRRAAPIVLRLLARGEEWSTNGKTIHLGPYRLDRIEADGTVVAGCHTFDRAEIERFAAVLGITTDSTSQ